MNDNSRRSLKIPAWHIPYMEKHRMYELFHELGRELVIQQPDDHVSFIKEILFNAYQNRDNTRMVLICPPQTNCNKLAFRISAKTKQVVITKEKIEQFSNMKRSFLSPSQLAKVISKLVRKDEAYKRGWILVDCLRNEAEAKTLLRTGILPTHCLYLVSPYYPNVEDLKYCEVPIGWPEYRRQLKALINVFKDILIEVHLQDLSPDQVAHNCIELTTGRKGKVTVIPRVVLMGPRGSGRRTQAQLLSKTLNLVHIDFEYLLCQAWGGESDISQKLRACKEQVCSHSELLVQLLNKRILEDDCLRNGWVLTGFPFTKLDLMYIDCLDTPPNRIIFLECDLKICRERVSLNRIDVDTGTRIIIQDKDKIQANKFELHPKDKANFINAEHIYYCEQYSQFRDYCGGTASIVNADQQKRWVHECILGLINKEAPPCPPRQPFIDEEEAREPSSLENLFARCKCGPRPPVMKNMFMFTL